MIEIVCIRFRFRPSEIDNSSPRLKTFRSFEIKTAANSPDKIKIIVIENSFHPLPDNPPLSQYKICVIELPEIKSKNPLTDETRALIAIPVKIILLVEMKLNDLLLNPFAAEKIISVVKSENKNATGVIKKNGNETGRIKVNIAPSPAPAEIPSSPGSARLFRSIDCKIIPEQESDAPTTIAFKILGSLMSNIIFLSVSFCAEKTSAIETERLPIDSEIIMHTISKTRSERRMRIFLDKN